MHPILFQYKYVAVYSFGAMLAVAFLCAISLVSYRAKRVGLPAQQMVDFCLWLLIVALIGARGLYVLQNLSYYQHHLVEIIKIQNGGLVFYGGLLTGFPFALIYLCLKKWSFWQVADLIAPSFALAHMFGRVGCFLNGCCFGSLTNVGWGVQFPDGSPAATEFGPLHLVHPTQLYSSVSLLILCLFLLWFDKRKRFEGQTFLVYLIAYSILRFVLEFFRGDNPDFFFSFTISQFISGVIFIAALFLFKKCSSNNAKSH